ncbi:unnamed protein product [Allacma fusca]|uniref:Uncharacterized protein n=1 Tax=Allacma fusca TaxID=39272 RepID=A0A8J2J8N7_9HEXA|nr:unnamed protein product [Allacma fusca]
MSRRLEFIENILSVFLTLGRRVVCEIVNYLDMNLTDYQLYIQYKFELQTAPSAVFFKTREVFIFNDEPGVYPYGSLSHFWKTAFLCKPFSTLSVGARMESLTGVHRIPLNASEISKLDERMHKL